MYRYLKRFMDILLAFLALLILSPIFILVILILLFTGEHEVFYKQKRIGQCSKPFYIWKFATMLKNSPNIGAKEITVRNDPRVTKVGRFLRISKINELPQIINVLIGEMSIVGPRPLMEVSYQLYPESMREKIYENKPGITGIGSIVFRDEEEIVSNAPDPRKAYESIFIYKAELEGWYLKNQSLITDLKIILLTAFSIFFRSTNLAHKWFSDLPHSHFQKIMAT